jgi:hypothetical protein
VTQRLAERYDTLVRQQEWTSQDNKQKVLARYVAHDPNFRWVKLATVRGSGASRVSRDVTVPLEKLSKTCQSRVRQIAKVQEKLDELLAAGPEAGMEGVADAGSGYGNEYGTEQGRGMRVGRPGYGYEPSTTEPSAEAATVSEPTGPDGGAYGSAAAEMDTGANDPDPLGFGELVNEPPLEASAGFGAVPPGLGGASSAGFSGLSAAGEQAAATAFDPSQWANTYHAFHANFTAAPNGGGAPSVEWGRLADLRAMNEAAAEHARDSSVDPYRSKISEIANRIGEVRWQGMLLGVEPQESGGLVVRFNYPPLPEPLKIRFIADESEASAFSELQPNRIVQFTGRFDIKTPNEIDVYIRLAN